MTTEEGSADPMSGQAAETIDSASKIGTATIRQAPLPSVTDCNGPSDDVGPINKRPKQRPTPYAKPILLTSDRKSRKRKSITWQSDEKIKSVRYFELIKDERTNVYNSLKAEQSSETPNGASPNRMLNTANVVDGICKRPIGKNGSEKPLEYSRWRPLILIDFTPTLPSPGWNSIERTAQADREVCVLGAIDLPGKPSTLDEPDSTSFATRDDTSDVKIIPLENPEGMYTEYPDMYNSEFINGVRKPSDNPPAIVPSMTTYFDSQQSHSRLLPDAFQQQLIQATSQNPFSFQEMSAQFQHQQPLPFQQQNQQTHISMPFNNSGQPQQLQQQDQLQPGQAPPSDGITGPIMPWLSYPFNQVNENSHAHLFRRPAT